MNWPKVSLLFISFILLNGCGSPYHPPENNYDMPNYDYSGTLESALTAAPLACGSGSCNNAFESIGLVAMVVEESPYGFDIRVGECTGFLFGASDTVALNSQCISDAVWAHKDNCSGFIGIKFGNTGGKNSEVRMCKKVLYRSQLDPEISNKNLTQDFAFFKIESVNRTALPLSSIPPLEGETITSNHVDPVGHTLGGIYNSSSCKIKMNSRLAPNYVSPWNDVALGLGCKIQGGNSGSPVLNSNSQVVGIAQSYLRDGVRKAMGTGEFFKTNETEFVEVKVPPFTPDHFQFTQMACMDLTHLESPIRNPKCRYFNEKENRQADIPEMVKNKIKQKDIQTLTSLLIQGHSSILKYSVTRVMDFTYSLKPECVLPVNSWDRQLAQITQPSSAESKYVAVTNEARSTGRIKGYFEMDEAFVLKEPTIKYEFETSKYQVRVSSAGQAFLKTVIVEPLKKKQTMNSILDSWKTPAEVSLPWCK